LQRASTFPTTRERVCAEENQSSSGGGGGPSPESQSPCNVLIRGEDKRPACKTERHNTQLEGTKPLKILLREQQNQAGTSWRRLWLKKMKGGTRVERSGVAKGKRYGRLGTVSSAKYSLVRENRGCDSPRGRGRKWGRESFSWDNGKHACLWRY